MKNVMVDLETLGTQPGCIVLSIGAVAFGPNGMGLQFHTIISAQTCRAAGLTEDEDTKAWWADQSEDAKRTLHVALGDEALIAIGEEGWSLHNACYSFNGYLAAVAHGAGCSTKDLLVWGNGANFDNPVLTAAFIAAKVDRAWSFRGDRCYRTMKALAPNVLLERQGTYHNAFDDALSQAEHLIRIYQHLDLEL